jgi:hypothetical protein
LLWRCYGDALDCPKDVVPTQEFRQFLDAQHQDVPDYDLLRFLRVTRMAKYGKNGWQKGWNTWKTCDKTWQACVLMSLQKLPRRI